jgi:hypothetical protein
MPSTRIWILFEEVERLIDVVGDQPTIVFVRLTLAFYPAPLLDRIGHIRCIKSGLHQLIRQDLTPQHQHQSEEFPFLGSTAPGGPDPSADARLMYTMLNQLIYMILV